MAGKQKALTADQQEKLHALAQEYVSKMDSENSTLDYTKQPIDALLALEAINDWSNGRLAEGGEIKLSYACTNPCAATWVAAKGLATLLHQGYSVIYPVSGFGLSEQETLTYDYTESTYRMTPHMSGSRSDAIGIAENQAIDDAEVAMKFWLNSAVEECMTYLYVRMDTHNLELVGDEFDTVRRILANALASISIGQAWSVIWRAVQHCAALSTRQFYNLDRASRQIPKKIDQFFNTAMQGGTVLPNYDRITENPMGAVLTLMARRFGITDNTSGVQVRHIFEDEAAKAPRRKLSFNKEDDGRYLESHYGEFYLSASDLSKYDRVIWSFFSGLALQEQDLYQDEVTQLYVLPFETEGMYGFEENALLEVLIEYFGGTRPSEEAIARKQAELQATGIQYFSWRGIQEALKESILDLNIDQQLRDAMLGLLRPVSDLFDVCRFTRDSGLESSIVGMRFSMAQIYPEGHDGAKTLVFGGTVVQVPWTGNGREEERPIDVVAAMAKGGLDEAGKALAKMFSQSIYAREDRPSLLRAMAKQLAAMAEEEGSA